MITKKKYETLKQFNFRKTIFEKIYKDIKDELKAEIYSNIIINIYSLGCEYSEEITEKVKPYFVSDKDNIYK